MKQTKPAEMKNNISPIALLVLIALYGLCIIICSCSSEERAAMPDDGSMRFTLLYPGEQSGKGVRATDQGFESSDIIGLYVTESGAPLQLGGNEVNDASMTFNGTTWQPATPVYWNNGKHYDAYAYYPYIAAPTSADACSFSVSTDQSTARTGETLGGYEASDFLWASRKDIAASKEPVALTFNHRMSRLVVKLVPGDDYEGELPDEKEISVYIHNTVPDATVDFASGMVTKDPYKTARSIKAKPVGLYSYAAIIVPQRLDKNLPLVEVEMKNVSYMVESKFLFKMGVQHTLMLTISKNPEQVKIEIGGEITDWEKETVE